MSIAIIVRESPGAYDENSLGLQAESEFKDWILQTCGFFVTVNDKKLYFIHQTAKEFVISSGQGRPSLQRLDWFPAVTDQVAHKIMAESSIAYLSLKCFSSKQFQERAPANTVDLARNEMFMFGRNHRGWTQLRENYGFLSYTIEFWARHFKSCQSFDGVGFRDVDEVFILHYMVLFTTGDCCAEWVLLHVCYGLDTVTIADTNIVWSYSVCDAAVWFDHGRLLVHSLGHNARTNESFLHAAAKYNAVNCVEYLAAKGVDVNARDKFGATALCSAASRGAIDAVNMLLDYNADVSLGAAPDRLPLSYILGNMSGQGLTESAELKNASSAKGRI